MLAEIIKNNNNIVFFGGAGVSTESNIPDFRSDSRLYAAEKVYGYPPEVLLSYTTLREIEDIKIQCAKKHFEALGYEVVENAPLAERNSKYVRKQNYRGFALER